MLNFLKRILNSTDTPSETTKATPKISQPELVNPAKPTQVAKQDSETDKSEAPSEKESNDFYRLPTVDKSTPGFVQNPRASALIKHSTQLKRDGDMSGAIEALEDAAVAIKEGKTEFPVETHCKLPLYLQQAGRGDEAVQKFMEVLELYPPSWGKKLRRDSRGGFRGHIERQRSTVYDKLRLVLQRDGKFEEALPYALLAETYWRRIDNRIYQYVVKKWEGKPKPPEPDYKAPSAQYKAALIAESEWYELESLKKHYSDSEETPELKSVATLLKKLKAVEALPIFQGYARDLVSDFKKSDEQVIQDIRELCEQF